MAPAPTRRPRRRAGHRAWSSQLAGSRDRSAEDWWWDRLAPSGSEYHLLQADSMLLVLPGLGPSRARVHRRASRRTQRRQSGSVAAAKPRPRPRPEPAPAPEQADAGWGDRIPLEVLVKIFGLLVATDGPMPFLGRYTIPSCVSSRWISCGSPRRGWLGAAEDESVLVRIHLCSGTYWESSWNPGNWALSRGARSAVGWGQIGSPLVKLIAGIIHEKQGTFNELFSRAARVCRHWHDAASQPTLWHTVTLSSPLAGRAVKGNVRVEKKLLASLEWLMPNRFSQLQRLTLIHWKSQVHPVLKLVSESCPRLTFLKLSDCHGVTADTLVMLAKACGQLHSLNLQHSMVESTAVVSFLEEAGSRMRKLWLTYSSQTTAILGALLSSCCPQLQVLDVSSGINHNSTPLQLPVEALQKGCPRLQVLRLLNLMWLPKPSGRGVALGPGFPSLEELCLASSTGSFVSNEVLDRLLHSSPNLRLLDLRGCTRITPAGLHDLPCQELEQLHLGLYGVSDRLTLVKEGSSLLTQKWYHTLRELDLSGQGFSEKDLEQALAAFSGTPVGSQPALCSLNLRATRVTPNTVSALISSCPGLLYLNLESCRCLPRGLKRAYRGVEEVQRCLEQLLTSHASPS